MIWIVYSLLFFFCARFFTALVNLLAFHYLPKTPQLKDKPKVSVLIPARNEEEKISDLLNQLLKTTYESLEIIVYNDNSTDNTEQIVQKFSQNHRNFKVISGGELSPGWLGKNHACHNLAKNASGDYFLFLDADVEIQDGLIERALNYLLKFKLKLLSIFPKQIISGSGEQLSVPLMNWILLSFLPMPLIRKSANPAFAAANGQFMFFDAQTYKSLQPHKLFKAHKVEDIAISQYLKKKKIKTDTLLGNNYIRCRMYNNLPDAVDGFSKNIFQFFGNSVVLTILVGIITTITPFLVYFCLGFIPTLLYVVGAIFLKIFVSLASKQSVIKNLVYQIPQHLVFLYIIFKGIKTITNKELIWKGRNILQV